jgi:serine/threonine protein kinase
LLLPLPLPLLLSPGGALTNRVSDLWESALTRGGLHMDEQEACYYLRQFISAMDYLHRHKVAHRFVYTCGTGDYECVAAKQQLQ